MEANKENFHGYNTKLHHLAVKLRKRMTKAEACLWKYALRAGMRKGYGFRKQRPVLNYIADFMCKELKLIIEVDGITHTWKEVMVKDKIREDKLRDAGFTIIRFDDDEILKDINGVIEKLDKKIEEIENNLPEPVKKRKRFSPPPAPPHEGDI